MPVAIDSGVVVQYGARQGRTGQQQLFGTKFNSIFDFCGVQIDVGVFWNDGASHGVWVIGDERCHGEAGQSDGTVLLG